MSLCVLDIGILSSFSNLFLFPQLRCCCVDLLFFFSEVDGLGFNRIYLDVPIVVPCLHVFYASF